MSIPLPVFQIFTSDNYTEDDLGSGDYDSMKEPCFREENAHFNRIFLPTVYSIIFLTGIVGNGLVILVMGYQKKLRVHCVSNVIQQSYPLLSSYLQSFPGSGSFLMTQRFASDGQSIGVLEFQLQHQSLQLIFRVDFFRTDWLDLLAG